ncbi:carbohydrate ABC transporter permease, partial [Paenibacillus agaridevorans]|uniref:carbohydrate ABC transporter permease n=1 Tax=Paenibacillus agaridevorans TaxID=171404 RepID=UPI001C63A171
SVYSAAGERMAIDLNAADGNNVWRAILWALVALDVLCAALLFRLALSSYPALNMRFKRFWKFFKYSRTAYLLIIPAFLFIVIFEVVPTAMAFIYSFTNFNLSSPLAFTGFANFQRIGADPFFWIGIGNMLLILITAIIKELTMPLLAAELVFWLKSKKMKYFFRSGFVLTSIVPGIVVVLLWKMIYSPESGLINEILSALGLGHLQRAWLGDEQLAIWSIIFAGFPFISVFAFLIYLGGLIGINREIYDSAQIDGVNVWNRFLKIDMPLILPQIQLILFFTFIGSIQGFANIWIFTRGGPGVSTYVPGLQMYFQISDGQYGYASAIGFVLAIMVLLVTYVNSRLSRQEEV